MYESVHRTQSQCYSSIEVQLALGPDSRLAFRYRDKAPTRVTKPQARQRNPSQIDWFPNHQTHAPPQSFRISKSKLNVNILKTLLSWETLVYCNTPYKSCSPIHASPVFRPLKITAHACVLDAGSASKGGSDLTNVLFSFGHSKEITQHNLNYLEHPKFQL